MVDWNVVEEFLFDAKAIAWDECHKIYVLMDDEQVELMRGYGYDPLITTAQVPEVPVMLQIVKDWFENSCSLKFVSAVATNPADPNAGFTSLIEQGAEWDDEEEEGW